MFGRCSDGRAAEAAIRSSSVPAEILVYGTAATAAAAFVTSQSRRRAIVVLGALVPLTAAILLAVHPLLSLFEHNQSEVELSVLWRPLALCVAVAAVLYGVFMVIFKRPTKAGALASLVIVSFFYYGTYLTKASGWGLSEGWFIPLWVLLFLLGALVLVRTESNLVNLTIVLTVGAAVWTLVPAITIARYQSRHPPIASSDPRLWPTALKTPVVPSGKGRPDIYVIIPDDYARPDVLRRYFHYDDSAFIQALRERGFVLSEEVRSPYSDSEMNIAAEMNMDYLSGLARILGRDSQDVRPVRRLIHDNRASRLLEALGYRYVHLDTDEVTFPAGNPHISPIATPDSFMTLWLQQTALGEVGGKLGFDDAATNARFREAIHKEFSRLAALPQEPGPKFVLFHTLLPHDPYIFGPRGQAVTFPDTSGEGHSSRLGMRYYLRQLRFTETLLLEATDAILARSKEPPIVVILSDEGFEGSEEVLGEAAVRDIRVKGFAAFHLPGMGNARPPRKLNTVNALRFVFNLYFATGYPMLRSASYPELDSPYQFEEMRVR